MTMPQSIKFYTFNDLPPNSDMKIKGEAILQGKRYYIIKGNQYFTFSERAIKFIQALVFSILYLFKVETNVSELWEGSIYGRVEILGFIEFESLNEKAREILGLKTKPSPGSAKFFKAGEFSGLMIEYVEKTNEPIIEEVEETEEKNEPELLQELEKEPGTPEPGVVVEEIVEQPEGVEQPVEGAKTPFNSPVHPHVIQSPPKPIIKSPVKPVIVTPKKASTPKPKVLKNIEETIASVSRYGLAIIYCTPVEKDTDAIAWAAYNSDPKAINYVSARMQKVIRAKLLLETPHPNNVANTPAPKLKIDPDAAPKSGERLRYRQGSPLRMPIHRIPANDAMKGRRPSFQQG